MNKGFVRGRFGDYFYAHKSELLPAFPSIMCFVVWMARHENELPPNYSPLDCVLAKKKHFKEKYFGGKK